MNSEKKYPTVRKIKKEPVENSSIKEEEVKENTKLSSKIQTEEKTNLTNVKNPNRELKNLFWTGEIYSMNSTIQSYILSKGKTLIICDCELRVHLLQMFFESHQIRSRLGFLTNKDNDFIREISSKDVIFMSCELSKYWMEKIEFSFSNFDLVILYDFEFISDELLTYILQKNSNICPLLGCSFHFQEKRVNEFLCNEAGCSSFEPKLSKSINHYFEFEDSKEFQDLLKLTELVEKNSNINFQLFQGYEKGTLNYDVSYKKRL
eukprot:gene8889-839_t